MNTIHKAGALIIKDKKILLTKSHGKSIYITPGGKYEKGENTEECLRRELKEELQVTVKSFNHYKNYHFEKDAYREMPLDIELYFVEIEEEPKVSSEIESMEWLTKEDIENKKVNLAPSFDTFLPDFIKDGLL